MIRGSFFSVLASVLAVLGVIVGLDTVSADQSRKHLVYSQNLHPVTPPAPTPTPPKKYIVPFDRNQKAVITNGPGEGYHTVKSSEAIDFSPRGWTQVRAAKGGTIYINNQYSTWGYLVVLQHGDGYYSYYPHLASQSYLSVGSTVAKGDVIGTVGNTGSYANGTHAHLEVRDQMSGGGPGTGDSTNHSIRRLRGIGWFPWYPNTALNSGFVTKSTSHPLGVCLSNNQITVGWLAPSEYLHTLNGQDQVDGFSYGFSTDSNYLPDKDKDIEENIYTLTSNPIPITPTPTKWFFHLRVKMISSNPNGGWASDEQVSHQGAFVLGANCPSAPTESDWEIIDGADE
ncbi:M23 family metallopeptidase [Anaerolineae bacterium CFX7]|nr:M23 family metallopeptidase [Anaerolineae bacterium CFX7]